MSFAAAYSAALKRADISRTAAAQRAQMDPATVTRILNGEQPAQSTHVRALIEALTEASERDTCVLAWLREQLPAEIARRIELRDDDGRVCDPPTIYLDRVRDDLDAAAEAIRRAARDGNTAARRAMIALARAVDPDPPDKQQRTAGGGPAATLPVSRASA